MLGSTPIRGADQRNSGSTAAREVLGDDQYIQMRLEQAGSCLRLRDRSEAASLELAVGADGLAQPEAAHRASPPVPPDQPGEDPDSAVAA